MHTTAHRILAAAAGAVMALTLVAPAQAAVGRFTDEDDPQRGADIYSARVGYGDKALRVHVTFENLVRSSERRRQSMAVYLDVDPARPGPERAVVTGLNHGSDYQLMRVRDWEVVGTPLTCDHSVRIEWGKDRATVRVNPKCLQDAGRVRVAVRADDERPGVGAWTDWLGEARELTRWIRRG